jgi:DME family drug/metabolite transporter
LIVAVGILPTALAYSVYLTGLRYIEATKASVYAITEPVTAALLAFYFFQETLTYQALLGFALIIGSILLISARVNESQEGKR